MFHRRINAVATRLLLGLFVWLLAAQSTQADSSLPPAQATYLGNEAVLVSASLGTERRKVLFDPFFASDYNLYQLVPDEIRQAIFSGKAPYDNINAIFISHAHGDHFSATDVLAYLTRFPATRLVAPAQAITQVTALTGADKIDDQLVPIALAYGDSPISGTVGAVGYDVVRIPHAGWPSRAEVSNLVFRVRLTNSIAVVHMGDADPDDSHFAPLVEHWNATELDVAFPPYWFFSSREGMDIMNQRLKAEHVVGVHVPVVVPHDLRRSGNRYFSDPGQQFPFGN